MALILIVEDSPDNMRLFETVLRLQGHTVTGLVDGERLMESLAESTPDLVLMDIQLPGKDGFTLLREIRGSEWRELRVIALTAHAMSGDETKAIEAGFNGYITKPINVMEFPKQVAQALDIA